MSAARKAADSGRPRTQRLVPDPLAEHAVGSPRDLDVLDSLDWAGFLGRAQLQALHFPSPRTAQRRLRVLLDAGLVRASLQGEALHRDNVFALTALGRERLRETGEYPDGLHRALRLPRPQKLTHALLVREAFVACRRHASRQGHALEEFLFDDDLTAVEPFCAHGLIPDGIAYFGGDGSSSVVALEIDRGTETRAMLRDKFLKWARVLASAPTNLPATARLVVLAPRSGRRDSITALLADAGLGARATAELQGALPEWLLTNCSVPVFAPAVRTARTASDEEASRFRAVAPLGPAAFRAVGSGTG